MTENNETQLNEAELSAVKNSIASLAKKYISGSFFDKLADSVGLPQAKTILANYMLAGDGMKSGIGYTESEEAPAGEPVSEASIHSEITGFRQFLSESRKNDFKEKQKKEKEEKEKSCDEKCCGGKKCYKTKDGKEIPKEKIDEAIAIVKAAGCIVDDSKIMPTEEEIAEAIKIAEANGLHVVTEKKDKEDDKKKADEDDKKKVEEALALLKSAGMKVNEASGDDWVTVPTLDVDPEDLRDAIDDGIALKYIKGCGSITNISARDGKLIIQFNPTAFRAKDILSAIRDGLKEMFQEDAGSVVAYGEEVVDGLDHIFDAAIEQA